MPRILLLCDTDADYQTERLTGAISRAAGNEFEIRPATIGRGGDYTGGMSAILRLRAEEVDVVHAWGGAALAAAALGTSIRAGTRIIYSPTEFPSRRALKWLSAVMAYRDLQVVATTATMQRRYLSGGIAADRCHLVRPGVDFARIKRRRNPELRAALRLSDDDFVILAAGESTRAAAHDRAVWATGILNVLDPHYKLLMWGRGDETLRLKRFAQNLGQSEMVRIAQDVLGRPVDFDELLAAADMILVTASGPVATLPIAIAMAAGLPIISTVTYTVSELLEDRHTALMIAKATPKLLARRILDAREDAGLQWAISDMAKTEAFEYFAMTRFVNQWRGIYRSVCARAKVEVRQMAPGAGLRFHGRG